MATKSLEWYFSAFRKEYDKVVGKMTLPHAFTVFCAKYFYFTDSSEDIDEDFVAYIPDGKDDGGIDAIFANPSEGSNELIILQGKFYKKTSLGLQELKDELNKIIDTVQSLQNHKYGNLNEQVKGAYHSAMSEFDGDDYTVKIDFVTFSEPTKKQLKSYQDACAERSAKTGFQIRILTYEDIHRQVVSCESATDLVDSFTLKTDKPNNALRYGDSVVVNISAQSLADLYNTRQNRVLGRNLRYHIKSGQQAKDVDSAISKTIKEQPDNFWYLNNGILIACEEFDLRGTDLTLKKFSIVNGGQTTYKVAHAQDLSKDFFIQCKVVVVKGTNETEKSKFCLQIANATNSQKPIKAADLRSNEPEQLLLGKKLKSLSFYYVTKAGDKPPKGIYKNYQIANMDKVGKAALAGALLLAGTARSSPSKMFTDYYDEIFMNPLPKVITDVLTLQYYFKTFQRLAITKAEELGLDDEDRSQVIKNAEKYYMACLGFLAKIKAKVFTMGDIKTARAKGGDSLFALLKKTAGLERIVKPVGDVYPLAAKVFMILTKKVLAPCCKTTKKADQMSGMNSFVYANYFKKDSTFRDDIIPELWSAYTDDEDVKKAFDALLG